MGDDKNKKKGKGKKIGMAVAGVAAAVAAGVAYLSSKRGEKHRKQLQAWMRDAKHDVINRLEKMEEVTKEEYDRIVDTVADEYKKAHGIAKEEMDEFSRSLKNHWNRIAEEAEGGFDDAKERLSEVRRKLKEQSDFTESDSSEGE